MLQGWLLYTELIQFSVQLHIQSLLWVILHVQSIIVVSKIVLSLDSISTSFSNKKTQNFDILKRQDVENLIF